MSRLYKILVLVLIPVIAFASTHSQLTNTASDHELHQPGYTLPAQTMTPVANQTPGDLWYNPTPGQYNYWNGSAWVSFSGSSLVNTNTPTPTPTVTNTPTPRPTADYVTRDSSGTLVNGRSLPVTHQTWLDQNTSLWYFGTDNYEKFVTSNNAATVGIELADNCDGLCGIDNNICVGGNFTGIRLDSETGPLNCIGNHAIFNPSDIPTQFAGGIAFTGGGASGLPNNISAAQTVFAINYSAGATPTPGFSGNVTISGGVTLHFNGGVMTGYN